MLLENSNDIISIYLPQYPACPLQTLQTNPNNKVVFFDAPLLKHNLQY